MFEAVGSFSAGKIDEAKLAEYECKACPTCGPCSDMYTANSMKCLTEALGMGLRENLNITIIVLTSLFSYVIINLLLKSEM